MSNGGKSEGDPFRDDRQQPQKQLKTQNHKHILWYPEKEKRK